MSDRRYTITVYCMNCGWGRRDGPDGWKTSPVSMEVPHGVTVREWLRSVHCERCGCLELTGQ